MKRTLLSAVAILFAGTMMAQSIVSTDVQNRNVIIEEYTGVNCQYCPDGHKRANQICEANPGRAWAINIHQGGYANGSGYETQWGDVLASQYNITGYPCGTVNRCPNIQSRGDWAATAQTVLSQVSPVNVAAEATIDPNTRELTVNVEVYYTGNQTVNSNFLNVVLLQDNVMGPQTGASTWYPEMVENGQYRHMHMLRHMLTGNWGEELTGITTGTLIERTYQYTLPAAIGAVAIEDFSDLKVLAFVTETHKNILTGAEAEITILPAVYVAGSGVNNDDCSFDFTPYVKIANTYDDAISSVTVDYDGTQYTINKTIAAGSTDTINMPTYTVVPDASNAVQNCRTTKSLLVLSATFVNNGNITISASPVDLTFADFNIYRAAGPINARVGIDVYGSEASVALVSQNGCNTLWTEGPWADLNVNWNVIQYISQIPDARYFSIDFNPATPGIYILSLKDAFGDGWTTTNNDAVAGLWLSDANGEIVTFTQGYSNGEAFSQKDFWLNITSTGDNSHNRVGIDDASNVSLSIYPNPTTDKINISCNEPISNIEVLDIAGRTVMTTNSNVISTNALPEGVYMLRVVTEGGVAVQKFVKE